MPFVIGTNEYVESYSFIVAVEGMDHALEGFSKMSAPKTTGEDVHWKNGTDMFIRKMPGVTHWEPVTLERVYSGRDELHLWWESILAGNIDRRTVTVTMLARDGVTHKGRYSFMRAYPSAWELPELDAGGSNTAIEKVTLTFEDLVAEL